MVLFLLGTPFIRNTTQGIDKGADRILVVDIKILTKWSGYLGTRLKVLILDDFEIFQAVCFGTSL